MTPASPVSSRARCGLAVLAVALLVLGLGLLSPLRAVGADTVPGRLGAVTLRCRGNQDLSDVEHVARAVRQGLNVYYARPALEGRALVSIFGPGPAWLGALTMGGLAPLAVVTDAELRARARVAASLAVAVSSGFVGLAALESVPIGSAVTLALGAALSFGGAATLGQGLWQQTAALPLLTGALAAAFWASRWPWLLPAVTASAACAAWIRPADLPLLLAVCALGARRAVRGRASLGVIGAALAAGVVGAMPPMSWYLWYLDTPLPLAQWDVNQRITERVFFDSARGAALGLAGLLVSPGRGVALFAPMTPLVAALGWRRTRGLRPVDALSGDALLLACGVVLEWALTGSFFKWWGGAGYGPRLLAGATWVAAAGAALVLPHASPALRRALHACALVGALWGTLGLFRFDITRVEVELDRVHRPEPYFEWRAGPWSSLVGGAARAVLDAPPGPFRYCGERSLGPVSPP